MPDSGNKELTNVFAALYVVGCVAAVLAVHQSGVFTAVIQPPLILFCAVPGAYWLFHGAKLSSLKDLLINCGYPLIERFPLMLFTSAAVLLIGIIRWCLGMAARSAGKTEADAAGSDTGREAYQGSWRQFSAEVPPTATQPTRRRRPVRSGPTPLVVPEIRTIREAGRP